MEQQNDNYETFFVETYTRDREIVVPLIPAEEPVESGDLTRAFVWTIVRKYGLEKLDSGEETVGNIRYMPEYGHHYWLRSMKIMH